MRTLWDSTEAMASEMSKLSQVGRQLATVCRDRSDRAAGALLRDQDILTGTPGDQCPADLSEQI